MQQNPILPIEIVSEYVRKMGGPYIEYGGRIKQLSDVEYPLLFTNSNAAFASLQITNRLHQNMIQMNLNNLIQNENLRNKLMNPPTIPIASSGSSASSASPPAAASTLPFPKDGIALSAIDKFIELCGGIDLFQDLTTTDVNVEAQKPFTYAYSCSYCDYLKQQQQNNSSSSSSGVSKPIVFISHAWKYKFLDVIDAIRNHYQTKYRDNNNENQYQDPVIWFDLFTNNQHDAPDLDFSWWSTTFQEAIRDIGTTVMVLSPWSDPIPLTRAWCLYEIYCTIHTNSIFEIAMSTTEMKSFITQLSDDIQCIKQLFGVVNVKRSEAWNPLDLQRIFEIVENIGVNKINSLVTTRLREWLLETTIDTLQKIPDNTVESLELESNLGLLYMELSHFSLAESHLKRVYERILEQERGAGVEGEVKAIPLSENILKKMHNLAVIYEKQSNYEAAIPLLQQCITNYEQLYPGNNYSHLYSSKNSLGCCLLHTGQYQQAMELLQQCVDYFQDTLTTPDSLLAYLSSSYNLAVCYDYLNQLTQAKDRFTLLYTTLSSHPQYGGQHYETLRVMTSLGSVYDRLNEPDLANEFYQKAYEMKTVSYGKEHESTLMTAQAYGRFLIKCSNYESAIPLFQHSYQHYSQAYHENNQDNEFKLFSSAYYLIISLINSQQCHEALVICQDCFQLISNNTSHQYYQFLVKNIELCEEINENQRIQERIIHLPLSTTSLTCHEHPLQLLDTPPYAGQGLGGCICDLCGRMVVQWVYHCESCHYDCHPKCILSHTLLYGE